MVNFSLPEPGRDCDAETVRMRTLDRPDGSRAHYAAAGPHSLRGEPWYQTCELERSRC